ncbi:MAG TPA: RNA polymerase sigma factor [Streptosporangiaceae bacterium]
MTDPEPIERFQALYIRHHGQVYAYAVSRAGHQLADEVVSEVFLIAWRRLAELPAPPLPWLLGVARNVIISQFRASARQQSITAELRAWVSEAQLSSADIAEEVSERISVLGALARLPDADRELLTLVAWHGLTPREAAQVVGCSTATYFVRLHRARRRLERAMADCLGSHDGTSAQGGAGRGRETPPTPPGPGSLRLDHATGEAPPHSAFTQQKEHVR